MNQIGSAILFFSIGVIFCLAPLLIWRKRQSSHSANSSEVGRNFNQAPLTENRKKVMALRQNLLVKTLHNQDIVNRLIKLERDRKPNATEEEILQNAIDRWEQDNR